MAIWENHVTYPRAERGARLTGRFHWGPQSLNLRSLSLPKESPENQHLEPTLPCSPLSSIKVSIPLEPWFTKSLLRNFSSQSLQIHTIWIHRIFEIPQWPNANPTSPLPNPRPLRPLPFKSIILVQPRNTCAAIAITRCS